jgi:hypothetical protein
VDASFTRRETVPVTVLLAGWRLRHVAGPGDAGGEAVADPAAPIIVEAVVRANLELVGPAEHRLDVPGADETHVVAFTVRATHLGRAELWIAVRQHGLPLLQPLVLAPAVVDDLPAPPPAGILAAFRADVGSRTQVSAEGGFGLPPPAAGGRTPQVLRIHEERHGDTVVYRYDLEAHDLQLMAAFASKPIVGDRDAYVRALYRRIEHCWTASRRDREMFAEQLRAFGADLLDELVPRELQQILWENRDRLRDVLVLSTEPFIPWELLHLKDPASRRLPAETRFLGQLGLLRWLWGPYPPEAIRLRPGRARHVVPSYPPPLELPQTRSEQAFLERAVGSTGVVPHHREVLALLKDGSFDLLHFAGHGRASGDDIADAQVLLAGRREGGRYVEEPLRVSVVRHNFHRPPPDAPAPAGGGDGGDDRPLVVVNACQTGRMGHQLSTIGGFAEAFVLGGAGAFVGCMWSVGDEPACEFVEVFYRRLLAGETVAAATAAGREAARRAGDATWLAYTVYAHPRAHLVREPVG